MRLLPTLFSGLVIAACSGATTTIGGDDTLDDGGSSSGNGGGSSSSSGSGGQGDGSASGDSGNGGSDATVTDGGTFADGGTGADGSTAGQAVVTITVTELSQSCQSAVLPDPVLMKGSISVQNNMATDVGPITMTDGAFYDPNLKQLATFKVNAAPIQLVASGAGGSTNIEKVSPSIAPAKRCQTLPCGGSYIVAVTLNAPQLGSYEARTVPIAIQCLQ